MGGLSASAVRMVLLQSTLLVRAGFRHAFPERGISDGALAAALELSDAGCITRAKQVHGAIALEALESHPEREADAIIVRSADGPRAAGVRVADCVPVLVADESNGDAAAIHAGWRGLVAGVVHSAIERLREGLDRRALLAAIGPCIGPCCFEVGDDVADAIARASAGSVIVRRPGQKTCVDLRAAVHIQLRRHRLVPARIEDVVGCTRHEPERFHSFRRDGEKSGRMLAAIAARRP